MAHAKTVKLYISVELFAVVWHTSQCNARTNRYIYENIMVCTMHGQTELVIT